MIAPRWHLPLLLSLAIASAPAWSAGGNETLFNFVKPMAVVTVTTQNADLPSATAEATPEGEILRRVNFNPAPQPTLRLAPSNGSWDWSQADSVSLRIQNAMDWAITLEVEIEGVTGAPGLRASIALPPGPAQTLLIPLHAIAPEDFGMRAGVPMPVTQDGQRLLLWFAVAMAAVAIAMFLPKSAEGDPGVRLDRGLVVKLAPFGLITGLAAGFFGIGGGFLIVPGLMAATGMTLANAAASSLVSVVLFGAATSASYAMSGLVSWPVFLALVLGGLLGTLTGLPLARRLVGHAASARRGFAVMVFATAAYVAVRAFM